MKKINWTGLIFILVALLVTLGALNIYPSNQIYLSLATVFLGYISLRGIRQVSAFQIIYPLALLFYFYNKAFAWVTMSGWVIFIIATLLALGVSMLIPGDYKFISISSEYSGSSDTHIIFGETTNYISIDQIDHYHAKTTFGETTVHFEKKDSYPQKTLPVQLQVSFGETTLFIPKEWTFDNQLKTSFAQVNAPRLSGDRGPVHLILKGSISFGEVHIIQI